MHNKHIVIDIMGGDHGPAEILNGVKLAQQELKNIKFTLVGDIEKCKDLLWDSPNVDFIDLKHDKEEEYKINRKTETSISKGVLSVKNISDSVFISAANTGKVVTESLMRLGRVKGVERPGIAIVIPGLKGPTILLDVGANADCRSNHLCHFAVLGSVYAKILFNKENPKVGLLNIGSESFKGSKFYNEVYSELEKINQIDFVGNIEPTTMMLGDKADVVVCDGFVGNMALKSMEGISLFTLANIMNLGFDVEKVKKLKEKIDYQEYGGALLLGVNGNVVITHGASKAKAIKSAIKFASIIIENNMLDKINEEIKEFNIKNQKENTKEGE